MWSDPNCARYLALALFGIVLLGFWITLTLSPIGLYIECMLVASSVFGITTSMILIGRCLITAYEIHKGKPRTYPPKGNLKGKLAQLQTENEELKKEITKLNERLDIFESCYYRFD